MSGTIPETFKVVKRRGFDPVAYAGTVDVPLVGASSTATPRFEVTIDRVTHRYLPKGHRLNDAEGIQDGALTVTYTDPQTHETKTIVNGDVPVSRKVTDVGFGRKPVTQWQVEVRDPLTSMTNLVDLPGYIKQVLGETGISGYTNLAINNRRARELADKRKIVRY